MVGTVTGMITENVHPMFSACHKCKYLFTFRQRGSQIPHFIHQTVSLNEPELIRRCVEGDAKAQRQLFDGFVGPMLRLVSRYVRDTADGEDIVMMAFTKVFNNLRAFTNNGEGALGGWIRKIVINEALMWLRRRHNFVLTEISEIGNEVSLDDFSQLPAEDIVRLVNQLPDGYRTVFNLSVIEGYDHAEIAGLLGIGEGTSRSQLFKAKALLKKMLTQEGFQYGT